MGRRPELKSVEKSKGIPTVLEISRCDLFAFSIHRYTLSEHHSLGKRNAPCLGLPLRIRPSSQIATRHLAAPAMQSALYPDHGALGTGCCERVDVAAAVEGVDCARTTGQSVLDLLILRVLALALALGFGLAVELSGVEDEHGRVAGAEERKKERILLGPRVALAPLLLPRLGICVLSQAFRQATISSYLALLRNCDLSDPRQTLHSLIISALQLSHEQVFLSFECGRHSCGLGRRGRASLQTSGSNFCGSRTGSICRRGQPPARRVCRHVSRGAEFANDTCMGHVCKRVV